jgi:hypothetical protein
MGTTTRHSKSVTQGPQPKGLHHETMSSAATDISGPFPIRGDGHICALISCVDTNSADGEFYVCIADVQTDFASGAYKQLPIPVVSKVAGTALVREPLQCDKPGARWACIRYVRSSGGAGDEILLAITVW